MAEKESGEDILRAILEKGSDKAKKAAADALTQQPITPADPPEVKTAKTRKRRKGLKNVAAKIGNSKYYYDAMGAIVDENGQPAPERIAKQLLAKNEMFEAVKKAMPKAPIATHSEKSMRAAASEVKKTIGSAEKLAQSHDIILKKMPEMFGQFELAVQKLTEEHNKIVQSLIKQNEDLQDKVVETLTGTKAPTKAGGAKPSKKAPKGVGGSRLAKGAPLKAATTKFRDTARRKEVLDRAARMREITEQKQTRMLKTAGLGGLALGGLGTAAILGGGGPAAPGPTGNQPSPNAERSSVQGMVTLTTPISKKKYVVAEQYAANFKGFVDELENSGYQIKSIGGYANRNIAGTGQKSFHSLGAAIDINPSTNPHLFDGRTVTDMPANVSAMARKYGLGWGGDWRTSKDTMHFSMASAEGGAVAINRNGTGPLPGAPAAPAPSTDVASATPGAPQAALAPSAGTPNAPTGAPARVPEGEAGERPTGAAGFKQIMEAARKAGDPFPEVVAGQWAIESGWGKHMTGRNNPFGQTGVEGRDPGRRIPTPRDPGGGYKFFRDFNSIDEAVALRVQKWAPWYAGKARTAEEALMMLQNYGRTPRYAQGYGNDWMSYVTSISSVIRSQGIDPKQPKEGGTEMAGVPGVPAAASIPSPGTPNAAAGGGIATAQGATLAAGSRARAIEDACNCGPGQLVVMNNNRTMNHVQTVYRGNSGMGSVRPGESFNPLAAVAAIGLGRALRLF